MINQRVLREVGTRLQCVTKRAKSKGQLEGSKKGIDLLVGWNFSFPFFKPTFYAS